MSPRPLAVLALFASVACTQALSRDKPSMAFQRPGPVRLTREGHRWAERTLKRMSLEEKIGQLLQVRVMASFTNVDSPEFEDLRRQLARHHIGSIIVTVPVDGPMLLRSAPYEAAMLVNELQRDSKYPLLVAADFERGASMRLNGTPAFPHAMAFGATGDPSLAERFGRVVAEESRAIGVEWNYFPVADVNSNPANPIVNTRSFGEDPAQVAAYTRAYIEGAHQGGMLATAKHFPGHGDTDTDSHLELARVGGDLAHLRSVELPPFAQDIAAGVDAIMVAHVTVPALEPDPSKVATTSHRIVTDLLKGEMGFRGIVVTDALEMRGLTRLYPPGEPNPAGRAAVDALKAGNDMILLPSDLDGASRAMLDAVRRGEVPLAQIDRSVLKILRAKASVGLDRARLVDIDRIAHVVGSQSDLDLAQTVADQAVTLVRNGGPVLPLKADAAPSAAPAPPVPNDIGYPSAASSAGSGIAAVLFVDDVRGDAGRAFTRALHAHAPGAQVFVVDDRLAGPMTDTILAAAGRASAVLAVAYVVPTAAKQVLIDGRLANTVGLAPGSGALLGRLLQATGGRTALIAMGNPYLAADLPPVQTYLCTFSSAPTSEVAAVEALFGAIPIHGRLPVTLPHLAARGFGIDLPANPGSPAPSPTAARR